MKKFSQGKLRAFLPAQKKVLLTVEWGPGAIKCRAALSDGHLKSLALLKRSGGLYLNLSDQIERNQSPDCHSWLSLSAPSHERRQAEALATSADS